MKGIINYIKDKVIELGHDNILGLYVYGSYMLGALQANSDLDLMVITRNSVSDSFRNDLTQFLLEVSGRIDDKDKRCVELSIFNMNDVNDIEVPLRCDYMYGEWLREELETNFLIEPFWDDDNVIVLWSAQSANECIYGKPLEDVSDKVSMEIVKESILSLYHDLALNAEGDQTNTILTLSRMWLTLKTDSIERKDKAAMLIKPYVKEENVSVLDSAVKEYLEGNHVEWRNYDYKSCIDNLIKLIELEEQGLVPNHKNDLGALNEFIAAPKDLRKESAFQVLEWFGDLSWPIARDLRQLIIKDQDLFIHDICRVLDGTDNILKYNLITNIFNDLSEANVNLAWNHIERIVNNPTHSEIDEEVYLEIRAFVRKRKDNERV